MTLLTLLWMPRWAVSVECVLQDCWIGVYWTTRRGTWSTNEAPYWRWGREVHLYLCLLPCLPLHVRIPRGVRPLEGEP